jgi:hypothetical protein
VWAVEPAVGCAAQCSCCVNVQVAYLLLRLCFRLLVHVVLGCIVHLFFFVPVAAVAQEYTSVQVRGAVSCVPWPMRVQQCIQYTAADILEEL